MTLGIRNCEINGGGYLFGRPCRAGGYSATGWRRSAPSPSSCNNRRRPCSWWSSSRFSREDIEPVHEDLVVIRRYLGSGSPGYYLQRRRASHGPPSQRQAVHHSGNAVAAASFHALLGWTAIGFLASEQSMGISAALVYRGKEVGASFGELAGECSSLMVLLKVVGPVQYSVLYVHGERQLATKHLPFPFNIVLAIALH